MKKEKKGRPITGKAREHRFTVRLNNEELDKLQQLAKKDDITISELLRKIIHEKIDK